MQNLQNMQNMHNIQNIQNKSYLKSKILNLDLRRIFAALLPTKGSSASSSISTVQALRGTAGGAAAGCHVAMARSPCCAVRTLLGTTPFGTLRGQQALCLALVFHLVLEIINLRRTTRSPRRNSVQRLVSWPI